MIWIIGVISVVAYQSLSGPPFTGFFVDGVFVDGSTGKHHVMREYDGPVIPLSTPLSGNPSQTDKPDRPEIIAGELIPIGTEVRLWRVFAVLIIPLLGFWALGFLCVVSFRWISDGFRHS